MFLRVPVDGKKRFFRGYFVFFTAVILAVVVAVTAGQFALYNLINNDDGRLIYEGKIIYNDREYEFEIDAATGAVLDWESESVCD